MPEPRLSVQIVRFSHFELDARTGELSTNGRRQTLPDQPLEVLRVLLERPGELVTRDELRRRLWPADTFVDFEHGLNAAVKRLRDALGDSADTPRFVETIPRRGYRFIAPVDRPDRPGEAAPDQAAEAIPVVGAAAPGPSAPLPQSATHARRRGLAVVVVVAAVFLIAVAGTWAVWRSPVSVMPPLRVVPLTTLPGWEVGPTFSPDGQQVAFAWNPGSIEREPGNNFDIYVKVVGEPDVRRLTSDPAHDYAPSWSPDGRQIAFLRSRGTWDEGLIYIMSAVGGSDLRVSDLAVVPYQVAWSPDSRYIAGGRAPSPGVSGANGIYVIPSRGGEAHRVTRPAPPRVDGTPAFSPDGRRLAYASCASMCDIDVIDLDASMNATGPPRRLATVAGVRRLDWSRDGRSIVYDDFIAFIIPSHLWRAGADGGAPPERIEVAGMAALGGGISWVRSRLAFSRLPYDVDIYKVERGRQPQAVALSSLADLQAAFSPDGRRIAFSSSRSGEALEIWVADSDGANPRQITHGPGRWQGSPHWSPDGRRVAFDSQGDDGHWHAWTVEVGSGSPRRVTNQPGDQTGATYSADGQWIYFAWDSGGGSDIWRTRAAGDGPVERMTTAGSGAIAFESPDGKSLVYQAQGIDAPLMTIPLSGGPARRLVSCVRWTAFAVSARGFYYVPCGPGIDPPVRLLDPTTGQDRVVGQLEQVEIFAPAMGLAVSPDGKTILYNRHISDGSDLMLIENFR